MTYNIINEIVFGKVDGDGKKLTLSQTFMSGLVASTVGPLFNCPMDVVRHLLFATSLVLSLFLFLIATDQDSFDGTRND